MIRIHFDDTDDHVDGDKRVNITCRQRLWSYNLTVLYKSIIIIITVVTAVTENMRPATSANTYVTWRAGASDAVSVAAALVWRRAAAAVAAATVAAASTSVLSSCWTCPPAPVILLSQSMPRPPAPQSFRWQDGDFRSFLVDCDFEWVSEWVSKV